MKDRNNDVEIDDFEIPDLDESNKHSKNNVDNCTEK